MNETNRIQTQPKIMIIAKTLKMLSLFVLIAVFSAPVFSQTSQEVKAKDAQMLLAEARKAFQSFKPLLANKILEQIRADSEADAQTRVTAGLYLSRLATKVFGDFEKAKEVLDQTVKLNPENHLTYLTYSQMASEAGRHELALANGLLAAKYAVSKSEKIAAYSSLGKFLLSADIDRIVNGPQAVRSSGFEIDKQLHEQAISQLERVIREDPRRRELLKTKFALEVIAGKGAQALETWRDYFAFSERSNPLILATHAKLKASLGAWTGDEESVAKRKSLALALAAARDFELSMLVIKTIPGTQVDKDAKLREIANYYQYLERLKAAKEAFYRDTAVGKSDPNEFRNKLISSVKILWSSFEWDSEPKPFSLDNVEIEIDKRFGAAIRIGNANGWFSITWGHKVIEYDGEIEQYGKKGKMDFRSLDYLVSNGFLGWYFGDDKIGGWQDGDIIYQVRTSYLSRPYEAWLSISDPSGLKDLEEKISSGTEQDRVLSEKKETVIFPGMAAQFELRSLRELLNDLKKQGLAGDSLRRKFVSEYEKLTFENEILSHEGRHLIDSKLRPPDGERFSADELEFRAKLSEVAFAKYPFMALSAIFKGGIGNTPHGKANERLAKAIYDWTEKNWREVKGIDESLPKPPQAYKLSDAQLVSIVRSLDPLAQGKE